MQESKSCALPLGYRAMYLHFFLNFSIYIILYFFIKIKYFFKSVFCGEELTSRLTNILPRFRVQNIYKKRPLASHQSVSPAKALSASNNQWLRRQDLNLWPLGYEPSELTKLLHSAIYKICEPNPSIIRIVHWVSISKHSLSNTIPIILMYLSLKISNLFFGYFVHIFIFINSIT